MSENINKSIAKGAVWMVALRLSIKGLGIISTIILARLLTPDDFGLIALASSIYAMIELIREFGFDTALIQNQKAGKKQYDSAWTMQVIFSLLASVLILVSSSYAASFYNDQRLESVLQVMAIIILVNGFTNIGIVDFRKNMTFSREFNYQLMIKLSGFCVTLPLAWYWQSYWALLMGTLSGNIMSLILSYKMSKYRPKFTLIAWREIMGFSGWLFFNNILFFINHHSQNFVLGKVGGTSSVGTFSIAAEIATLTTAEIVAPINRAAYPGYSKLAHNKEELKESYLKVLSNIILIAVPSAIGIAIISPIFVPVLLGEQWLKTIPVIQIIAIASILSSINTNSAYIYLVLKKQKITTYIMLVRLVIFIPMLTFLATEYGVIGAAFAMLLTSCITLPINQIMLKKQLDINWGDLFRILYRPFISSVIMGFIVYQFTLLFNFTEVNLLHLIAGVLLGGGSFITVLLFLWRVSGRPESVESDYILLIKNRMKKI
jgi:O-antigen/teichoic acid export membrane protein